MKFCNTVFLFLLVSPFFSNSFANEATAIGTSSFKIKIDTKKLCEAAFKDKNKPKKEIIKFIKALTSSDCTKLKCLADESKKQVQFISRNIKSFKNVKECSRNAKRYDQFARVKSSSFENILTAGLSLDLTLRRRQVSLPIILTQTCPSLPPGLSARSLDLSQQQSCNAFFQTPLASQAGSSNIGDIGSLSSMFLSDESLIFDNVDNPQFCESCLKDKLALQQLMSSTSAELNEEEASAKLLKFTSDMKEKVTDHLAKKRATEQVLKLTNIMQQAQHFKYSYGVEISSKVSCLNFKKLEKETKNKCKSKDQKLLKSRITEVFSKITGKEVSGKGLKIEDSLNSLLQSVKQSSDKCKNGATITREHFLAESRNSFNANGRKSISDGLLNALFSKNNIFKNSLFKDLREKNPNDFLSITLSKYIIENLKMDSQNADESIKLLFGEETEFSENAINILKETGLNIPLNGQEINKDVEERLKLTMAAIFEQVSNIDPILNILLHNQSSFEEISDDYFRTPPKDRKPFSHFLTYGDYKVGDKKIKSIMSDRMRSLLEKDCKKIKENFLDSICDQESDITKYSKNEVKDAIDELRAPPAQNQPSDVLAQGSLICEKNQEDPKESTLILPVQSPYEKSDIALESSSEKVEGKAHGYFNAFAISKDRACNAQLVKADIAKFQCEFRGECQQEIAIIEDDKKFEEIQRASSEATVDSSKVAISQVVADAKRAVDEGKTIQEAEQVIAQGVKDERKSSVFNASQINRKESKDTSVTDEEKAKVISDLDEKAIEVEQPEKEVVRIDQDTDQEDDQNAARPSEQRVASYEPPSTLDPSLSQDLAISPRKTQRASLTPKESKERSELIASLSEDFTPGQLETMSLDQLKELSQAKSQSKDLKLNDLEQRKRALQDEIADLEKQKVDKEIVKLEKEKQKLEQERQKIAREKSKIGIEPRPKISSPTSSFAPSTPVSTSSVDNPSSSAQISSDRSTASAQISATGSDQRAFLKTTELKSQIPADISKIEGEDLGASVGNYLRSVEVKDLLYDERFVKFEKDKDKIIAVYVQNTQGKMVRIPIEKLDRKTQIVVRKYQQLSQTNLPSQEGSVLSRIAQLEKEIEERKRVQSKRKTTLDSLNAELSIFDRQIRGQK